VRAAGRVRDAREQVRLERRRQLVEVEPVDVDALPVRVRVAGLQARRGRRVLAVHAVEGRDGDVAADLDVVLPARVDVAARAPGRCRVRDVVDAQAGAHRPDERVVVRPAVERAPRLELDVGADEAADVRNVEDVAARAGDEARLAHELARKREVARGVGGVGVAGERAEHRDARDEGDDEHDE
jgi:hypothetical protein